MIFFTTFVTLIQRQQEGTERRLGSPALVEGNTLRLPIGTEVRIGDYVEHRSPHDGLRMMAVIDVIYPHMADAIASADHIEVTCVPSHRVAMLEATGQTLHPTMSAAFALAGAQQMSAAISEALRLVEERVQSLAASGDSGRTLMESVFGPGPPQLDITTTIGPAADDEREGFRLLFIGAILGLAGPHRAERAVPITLDETLEYLAVASMLMRRLDLAERRLR